ncbi:MAG: NUDIX hydrolase [Nitrososphaerota archaeon]|jgi:ADP-ribose pyrophosphatase YjhB (NUDIX family)|nr:NUDIX hydrolase [Nitrososphaerota archaeon]
MKKYIGKTATAIIPYPNNTLLLIKRNTCPFINYWALPGGRMEPNETSAQTILREVKEETGLDVVVVDVLGDYVERGVDGGVVYEYFPTCFVVQVVGGELRKQDSEIQDIQLFSIDALPRPLAFEHEKMIEDYVHAKRRESLI